MSSRLAENLRRLAPLGEGELAALGQLELRERSFSRGATLQREHEPSREIFVLTSGGAMSSVLLDDGSRQILRFHFPGDLMASANLIYRRCAETITALSPCTVCAVEPGALAATLEAHPRLAAMMMVLSQIERTELTDRLAGLGRTTARARVAAVLIEIRNQQRRGDPTIAGTFTLGLTQEEIGDATGLTAVHVNRMLRQLEEDGLIVREPKRGRVTFRNEERLVRESNFLDRYAELDLGWLPPPA